MKLILKPALARLILSNLRRNADIVKAFPETDQIVSQGFDLLRLGVKDGGFVMDLEPDLYAQIQESAGSFEVRLYRGASEVLAQFTSASLKEAEFRLLEQLGTACGWMPGKLKILRLAYRCANFDSRSFSKHRAGAKRKGLFSRMPFARRVDRELEQFVRQVTARALAWGTAPADAPGTMAGAKGISLWFLPEGGTIGIYINVEKNENTGTFQIWVTDNHRRAAFFNPPLTWNTFLLGEAATAEAVVSTVTKYMQAHHAFKWKTLSVQFHQRQR